MQYVPTFHGEWANRVRDNTSGLVTVQFRCSLAHYTGNSSIKEVNISHYLLHTVVDIILFKGDLITQCICVAGTVLAPRTWRSYFMFLHDFRWWYCFPVLLSVGSWCERTRNTKKSHSLQEQPSKHVRRRTRKEWYGKCIRKLSWMVFTHRSKQDFPWWLHAARGRCLVISSSLCTERLFHVIPESDKRTSIG